jgi:hypothetical protein
MEYWVAIERVYKLVTAEPISQLQAQVMIENGLGSLKEINWDFDEELKENN